MDETLSQLAEAEQADKPLNFTYLITFEVYTRIDENVDEWVGDERQVRGNEDAMSAIDRLKAYIHSKEYGVAVKGFRLRAIKPLAEAEV